MNLATSAASLPVKGQGAEAHIGLLKPRGWASLLRHIFYARTALYSEAGHGGHNTTINLRTRFSVRNGWSVSANNTWLVELMWYIYIYVPGNVFNSKITIQLCQAYKINFHEVIAEETKFCD